MKGGIFVLRVSQTTRPFRFLISEKTWLPLLKLEHTGQTADFAYISKNNRLRQILTLGKSVQHDEMYLHGHIW